MGYGKMWYPLAVKFLRARSGILSAVAIIVLLAVAIIFIAPQIDLELGVLGAEQLLYALLMAVASIVVLKVTSTQGQVLLRTPAMPFALFPSAAPPVLCSLLC
jgi:hypothetical protein